jgi:hypothetical protein
MSLRRYRAFSQHALLLAPLLFTGCTRAPSLDLWGSFFPAWLICFIVSVVLTAATQLLLRRFRLTLALPVLTYASLAALYTFALWLMFLR